jgi:hypothetical protein
MSVVSESVRATLVARAEERCEYCHLPMRGQVAAFPVDHVTPRNSAGTTTLDNLALACPATTVASGNTRTVSIRCPASPADCSTHARTHEPTTSSGPKNRQAFSKRKHR